MEGPFKTSSLLTHRHRFHMSVGYEQIKSDIFFPVVFEIFKLSNNSQMEKRLDESLICNILILCRIIFFNF